MHKHPSYTFLVLFLISLFFFACQANQASNTTEKSTGTEQKSVEQKQKVEDVKNTETTSTSTTKKAASFPTHVANQLDAFKELIAKEDKQGIADLFDNYPIKRPNLLIHNDDELIANYHLFVSDSVKQLITEVAYNTQDVFFRNGHYSILNGGFWFYDNGEILRINVKSDQQKSAAKENLQAIEQNHHESTRGWSQSILRFETAKFIVHLYYFKEKGYQYFSWSKPKTSAEKPDLALSDGKEEIQGSMGGSHYIFTNGAYTYKVLEIRLGTDERNGIYLQVYQGDDLILEQKAERVFE